MKPQVPSIDSSQETLSTFLANDDYRKSWNILLDTAKNYRNLEAKAKGMVRTAETPKLNLNERCSQ